MNAKHLGSNTWRLLAHAAVSALLVVALSLSVTNAAFANPGIITSDLNVVSPATLVTTLLGGISPPTVSNVAYGGANVAAGTFAGGAGIIGLDSGVILSSGDIASVVGPNTADNTTANNGQVGDPDLQTLIPGYTTFDAAVLEFDFDCEQANVVSFRYVFTSEEYNEYVNTAYNDVFGFFLDGVNIALLPDNVTPVSINNVNGGGPGFGTNPSNPAFYINNDLDDGGGAIDIEADGLTVVLGAQANISPGIHHMKLGIADAGDSVLDSWVFIEAGSFDCAPLEPPDITLEPATASNEAGTDHTVTATVFAGGAPLPGAQVSFAVTAGPNAGEASDPGECTIDLNCTTDGAGQVSWTYTGAFALGTDTIRACFTFDGVELCDSVTKGWVDTTPPDLVTPPDATNEATGPDGAAHDFVATATDDVDPNPAVVCVPPSGTIFPLGETVVTCTATDASGNVSVGTFTKTVEDTTPPVPQCIEGVNPGGKTPGAPGKGGQGQNQDGFYQLLAGDIVDLDPAIYVVDMGADNVFGTADDFGFGPFANLMNFKYTEANGADPSIAPGSGDVDWRIKGQGDAAVYAVDLGGNRSDPASCLVPPPPQ